MPKRTQVSAPLTADTRCYCSFTYYVNEHCFFFRFHNQRQVPAPHGNHARFAQDDLKRFKAGKFINTEQIKDMRIMSQATDNGKALAYGMNKAHQLSLCEQFCTNSKLTELIPGTTWTKQEVRSCNTAEGVLDFLTQLGCKVVVLRTIQNDNDVSPKVIMEEPPKNSAEDSEINLID